MTDIEKEAILGMLGDEIEAQEIEELMLEVKDRLGAYLEKAGPDVHWAPAAENLLDTIDRFLPSFNDDEED